MAVAYGNIFALMAAYIQDLSETYAISNYKADSIVLRQGEFVFNDYTLHSKFNYILEDLIVNAESVSSASKNIVFKLLYPISLLKNRLYSSVIGFVRELSQFLNELISSAAA
jgi:hypothetical protein